jgi:hypothetical protein
LRSPDNEMWMMRGDIAHDNCGEANPGTDVTHFFSLSPKVGQCAPDCRGVSKGKTNREGTELSQTFKFLSNDESLQTAGQSFYLCRSTESDRNSGAGCQNQTSRHSGRHAQSQTWADSFSSAVDSLSAAIRTNPVGAIIETGFLVMDSTSSSHECAPDASCLLASETASRRCRSGALEWPGSRGP